MPIFKEDKKDLIKVFEISYDTKIQYVVSTIMHIMNRWKNIRIYIFNINHEVNKNEKNNK